MKISKKILIAIIFVAVLIFCKNASYAGTQRLNSLDYDVELNSNGSMDVVETWNIYVSETNTLFKNFDKQTNISNVSVMDLETMQNFTQIDEEMYHVTKNCFYALPISGNKFEIAWGVGLDDSSATKKYQISYTVEDAVTVYNDCSEFYWMFVSKSNGISAKKVTGTIKLPKQVSDIEALRVWAHGPLNGEINKTSNDTIEFFVEDFDAETMLEARIVVEEEIFENCTNIVNQNKLDSIIAEETEWADEANEERQRARRIIVVIGAIYLVILIFFGKKILKYRKELNELPTEEYTIQVGEYFRDIPREETATPAEAAYLYYSNKNTFGFQSNESKIFSATLLQLCLKGYIAFEKDNENDIKIILLDSADNEDGLRPTEQTILRMLKRRSEDENYVTIKQIKEYAKESYDAFGAIMNLFQKDAKKAHIENGNYNEENEKKVSSYNLKVSLYVVAIFFVTMFTITFIKFMLPLFAIWGVCIFYLNKCSNKIKVLTEQGEIERKQWKGLKKYMEDFSMLDQRDIPDLVLWEKYLVYATAFGIADKVIKQLKVVYPEIDNINDNQYTYMHYMSSSHFGDNFISDFNKGIDKAYSAYKSAYSAAHSSGSGGGGGFSGGGGGRRWRRPEWAEDKVKNGELIMKIGIDIGGSHIGIGLIKKQEIVDIREKNFNREDRKNIEETIISSIQMMIFELLNANKLKIEDIKLIGIAAPGTISNGVIVKAGNLNLKDFDIVSKLKTIYSNPIQIRNDGKCAALAEKKYGAMKNFDDCVFINIGTGIGGAAFIGGKLLEPKKYSGFEFGHMVVNKGGRLCSCGKQGCFEAYSSIKALKMKVTETLDVDSDISGQYLREELLIKDDPRVKEDIDVFLEYLKTGISNLIDIFEPEVVCLGGSFAYYEGNPILAQLIEKLNLPNATFNSGNLPQIVTAKLKNNAGIIGAVIE